MFSVQHTSASLTINENYDSDVRDDTERFLNIVVPEVGLSSAFIANLQYSNKYTLVVKDHNMYFNVLCRGHLHLGSIL